MPRRDFIAAVSALDGRIDKNIKEYVVSTEALRRVLAWTSPTMGIVGLKGTGKSTLYRHLVENWRYEPNVIAAGFSPTTSAFEPFVDKINCLQFEKSVRQGIAPFLLRSIDENLNRLAPNVRARANSWIERKVALLKPQGHIATFLSRFNGFSILGCGLSIGDPALVSRSSDFRPLSDADDAAIWKLLRDFGKTGLRLRVVVDDPDRLFARGPIADPHLLAGYVLGTNWVAADLPYVQFVHILKKNIFESLCSIEEIANLPSDYFSYISWSEEEFLELVDARMKYASVSDGDIFSDPKIPLLSAIADQIRNGPRDLLRYAEIILKKADDARLSLDGLAANEAEFKLAARRQMRSVYDGLYDGVEALTATVFGDSGELSVQEFEQRFLSNRLASLPAGLDYDQEWLRSAERCVKALIEVGAIDAKVGKVWARPFEAGYFSFDPSVPSARVRLNAVFR